MSEITTIVDPVELTELARIAANDFDTEVATLSRFLPSRETADIRYGYNKADDFFVDPTPFRAYDAETPIGRRGGLQRITGEIPALGRKIPLSEYAQLRLRNASDSEVADQARKDAIQEARSIAARAEQARGELLTSGKVIIAENGFVSTYDSGRNAALTVTALAGTAKWTDTDDSVPLDNIETLAGLTKTHGGLKGNHVIFGEDAYTAFVNTDQVKSSALRMAVADLREGGQLVMFPEGTRTTQRPTNPFRPGFALIAKHAKAPIQAVFIDTDSPYLGKGWPLWRLPPLPITFSVRIGRRFEPSNDANALSREIEQYYAEGVRRT